MTIRIDTARNRLDRTIERLQHTRAEIDDLHVLAYDRRAAAERLGVHGGDPTAVGIDLDTHGDRRAREVLGYLLELSAVVCDLLDDTIRDSRRVLTDGDSPRPRTRRTIDSTELKEALDAQIRRRNRGEYSPLRRYPQPSAGR